MIINIGSKGTYPSNTLSNFTAYEFIFDGIQCSSMEGVLQAFKFRDTAEQLHVVTLVGFDAKKYGKQGNNWRKDQTLYWNGESYDRHSKQYQELLTRAYNALFDEHSLFRKALKATGKNELVHTVGKSDAHETILTEREFVEQLYRLREMLN
ncbi:MAG: hypothetical protein LBC74_02345 [Planctomycetaceae bacterium]|jgi:predicted NAD-dependent protein-ADP-ribosyltransferase YbiA (DUF1768 family)|nr:hypothetical protein [Planctomycetaceae bacterium]